MIAVVLTVAIDVQVAAAVLVDPAERAAQYRAALTAWDQVATQTGAGLHLLDCTGASSDRLRAELGPIVDRTVVTSFRPTPDLLARGKGAVEAAALDEWMWTGPAAETTVFKGTGRLVVRNAARLLRAAPVAGVIARRRADFSWVDTRFIGLRPATWRTTFSGMSKEIDDEQGVYLEHVAGYRLLRAVATREASWAPFAERPQFLGRSGTTGQQYRALPTAVLGRVMRPAETTLRVVAGRKQL